MKILVTGAAGFIGSAVARRLAERGDDVVGIDNINDYYDPRLKYARLRRDGFPVSNRLDYGVEIHSEFFPNYQFVKLDIADKTSLDNILKSRKFDVVVNLAAQAGVRYSIANPYAYLHSNLDGFLNVLEGCRHNDVKHLVFASSSSVYGLNSHVPFAESDRVDTPVSLYAASKKSNELMAHAYSKLYGFAVTGLRYFTVYGPWGRPDMSPMLFADAITAGRPINVHNHGDMKRDFTYIDDIVDATVAVIDSHPTPNENDVLYHIYNIGGSDSVNLMDFITELENACNRKADKVFLPMQPGDVYQTSADTRLLEAEIGIKPSVKLSEGIRRFILWYNSAENPLK